MEKKDGGAAFPSVTDHAYNIVCKCGETVEAFEGRGMSLRDWFAGQALMGVMAAIDGNVEAKPEDYKKAASWSYAVADALLAERSKDA